MSDTPDDRESPAITFFAAPRNGRAGRLVVASTEESGCHRDVIDTDSDRDRRRFLGRLEQELAVGEGTLARHADRIVAAADEADARAEEMGQAAASTDGQSQSSQLVQLAADVELFHDAEGRSFATIEKDGHHETHPLRRKSFKSGLSYKYYAQTGKAPNSQAMIDALSVLEGRALYDGAEHLVHVRLAGDRRTEIYIDLCDAGWNAIRITPSGWTIIPDPPVKFWRPKGMLPLPTPVHGGSLAELRQFLNVSDQDWPLAAAWLAAAACPAGPYPVCVLGGEQGTAKSTATRVLRRLLDPNKAETRSAPRDVRDLAIAANNSWVVSLDNLSYIPPWFSDALCRISSGGGFATRELYSDADEALFDACRPIVINGIEELANRGDLVDRSLIIKLDQIPDNQRRPEREFWPAFEAALPRLLGALCEVVSTAMRRLPSISPTALPRMGDFAEWAIAAEPAMGVADGAFLQAYVRNRASAHTLVLEGSLVASAILSLVDRSTRGNALNWTGTATELLGQLRQVTRDDQVFRQRAWPKNAKSLSDHLRRLAPNLRGVGIDVSFAHSGTRTITIGWPDRAGSLPHRD